MTTKNLSVPSNAPIAGIYDAQAFSVGNSEIVHEPHHFPTTNKVVAYCGVYGYAIERDARIVEASLLEVPNCPRCNELS